jgi:hypothetical protein
MRPRGRIFTSMDVKNRPRGKLRRWGKHGRTRTSGRKGRLDSKFYPKTSVMTTLVAGVWACLRELGRICFRWWLWSNGGPSCREPLMRR